MSAEGRSGDIIVVGGYGQVGREVVRVLAPAFPGRVVVAGRSAARAEALARRTGEGARGLALDITSPTALSRLEGAALVVMCLDQRTTFFVEQCLRAGIDYVDVTANGDSLAAFERLGPLAREAGSTAVVSVGIAPGLTQLLAAQAVSRLDATQRLDLFVLLGAGDVHGAAAIEWTLENLAAPFDVYRDGVLQRVHSFRETTDVQFPGERQARPAWRFNFPDQRAAARTLSVPTVSTWLRFDPSWLGGVAAFAVKAGLGRLLHRAWVRRALTWLSQRVHAGSDAFAVMARAEGQVAGVPAVRWAAVQGHREAEATGRVAAEVARELLTGRRPGGVLHLDQFVEQPEALVRRVVEAVPDARYETSPTGAVTEAVIPHAVLAARG
ncbi:saccharopine dehydrogenase family protein [Myxococcus hansupus]|uniref:saccharopine dehydrogenase family protein n=1 Tax=Pseudomyxococcus hansupus TaxID=1297742 RepID=UPI00030AB223|nr:saccharopine dehydrogenase NADP-binding domain-containing protein [Myxococcus hansupus]